MSYRAANIPEKTMRALHGEITGTPCLPAFRTNVIQNGELSCLLRALHIMLMEQEESMKKEETLLFFMEALIKGYAEPFSVRTLECPGEIARACEFIEQNFTSRLTLDQICRHAALSKSTLLRSFTKEKGVTPYCYLENLRISQAKKLLREGVSPADAASRTGFSDQVTSPIILPASSGLHRGRTGIFFSEKGKKRMETRRSWGHPAAALTVLIWGTTFISTKVLLEAFQPIEILFFRFVMGFLILLLVCPRRMKGLTVRQELTFVLAGLCGICLYYLLENIALTYTLASNVGVIISVAPFFTAILSHMFMKSEEKLRANFFVGFAVAMIGIVLISFNGAALSLNPKGDLLAIAAAFVWSCYSILTRKISGFGYSVLLTTRRTFFYGLLFMLPMLFVFDFRADLGRFANPISLLNILYLGAGASALCFVTWNFAVKLLGAVKTSVYIYLIPVITTITSVLILKEPITNLSALGTLLAVAGLFLSEYTKIPKRRA